MLTNYRPGCTRDGHREPRLSRRRAHGSGAGSGPSHRIASQSPIALSMVKAHRVPVPMTRLADKPGCHLLAHGHRVVHARPRGGHAGVPRASRSDIPRPLMPHKWRMGIASRAATRISSTPLLTIVDLIVRVMSRTSGRLHLECLGARYPGIAAAVM